VEHDPKRPFRVITNAAVIQAVGTQFDVYRQDGKTSVSVLQGVVKVSTPMETGATLKAGEEARIDRHGRIVREGSAEVARVLAWRQRKLDFRGATLSEVAEQFNRYNRAQIRIEDPAIAARQLNGVFNADEPQSLLDFLGQGSELRFDRAGRDILIRARGE